MSIAWSSRAGHLTLVALAAIALTGCAGVSPSAESGSSTPSTASAAPGATPSATRTAAPSLTPTATATASDEVTTVVITGSGIELAGGDNSAISRFGFDADLDEVTDALEALFGTAPTVTQEEDNPDGVGTTDYVWDEFSIRAQPDGKPDYYGDTYWVVTETATVGDIAIEAVGGLSVGDLDTDAEALAFDQHEDNGGSTTIGFYSLDKTPVDVEESTDGGDPAINFVRVWVERPGHIITRIDSPGANYGA